MSYDTLNSPPDTIIKRGLVHGHSNDTWYALWLSYYMLYTSTNRKRADKSYEGNFPKRDIKLGALKWNYFSYTINVHNARTNATLGPDH